LRNVRKHNRYEHVTCYRHSHVDEKVEEYQPLVCIFFFIVCPVIKQEYEK